jgi:hypothetical protein
LEKILKIRELEELLNMPYATLYGWKNSKDHRKIIYEILANYEKEELQKKIEAIKLIFNIQDKKPTK